MASERVGDFSGHAIVLKRKRVAAPVIEWVTWQGRADGPSTLQHSSSRTILPNNRGDDGPAFQTQGRTRYEQDGHRLPHHRRLPLQRRPARALLIVLVGVFLCLKRPFRSPVGERPRPNSSTSTTFPVATSDPLP